MFKKSLVTVGVAVIALLAVTVALAAPLLNLPATPVTATHSGWMNTSKNSTLVITLSNVPAGFSVTNMSYAGWCAEDNHQPNAGPTAVVLQEVTGALGGQINYLLNHRASATIQDVQVALWKLVGIYDNTFPETAASTALYNAAVTQTGFVPGAGQVVAVWVTHNDSQHQDTIMEVPVTPPPPPPPPGGEGCTPGYWRNHFEDWPPTGYSPAMEFDTVFSTNYFSDPMPLGTAINLGGGGVKKIARHGTAALLSAAHPDVNYPYTVAQVIAMVQSGNVDKLVAANELGCSIP